MNNIDKNMHTKPKTPLENYPLEDLQAEIERRNALAEVLQQQASMPQPLPEMDFQPLVDMVVEGLTESVAVGYVDEDFDHYVYEEVMNTIFGKNFWKWYNSTLGK